MEKRECRLTRRGVGKEEEERVALPLQEGGKERASSIMFRGREKDHNTNNVY